MICILYILQYFLGFFEIYLCFIVLNRIYNTKISKIDHILILISSCALAVIENINRCIRLYSMILIIFVILVISLIYHIIFKKTFVCTILYTSLYLYGLALLDLFVIFIIGFILNQNNIGIELGHTLNMERIIVLAAARGLVLFCYTFLVKSRKIIPRKHIKTLFIIFIAEIIGVYYFQSIYAGDSVYDLAGKYFVYLVIIILGIIAFSIYVIYREVAEESKFIIIRNSMLEHNYEELKAYYIESRTLFHDYIAHITLLQKYLSEGNINKAQNYITNIVRPLNELERKISTGIEVVDLIINYKMTDIKDKNIDFKYEVSAIELNKLGIEESDLFVILYNLFNNAIEACEKITNNERWISLTITNINSMFMIRICNSIQERPEDSNGYIKTSKSNKEYHGIGLNSVKNILEKYGAHFEYNCSERIFEVVITFF